MLLNILLLQGLQHLMFRPVLPVSGCWLLPAVVVVVPTQRHTVVEVVVLADT
jgi:hypothetical protein